VAPQGNDAAGPAVLSAVGRLVTML
jgi:hypothetical protein